MVLGLLLSCLRLAPAQDLDGSWVLARPLIESARALAVQVPSSEARPIDPCGPAAGPGPRIVVVGVDKRTQQAPPDGLGKFGASYRAANARLIERLDAAGIRGVAFDIYFAEKPEWKEDTRTLIRAAAASRAPVVVSVYAELRPDGKFAETRNDPGFDAAPAIGQGSINFARETVTTKGDDWESSAEGPVIVVASAAGRRGIVEELLVRTGFLRDGQVRELGLVRRLNTSFNGRPVSMEVMSPALGEVGSGDVCSLGYRDILEGRGLSSLSGALVLVGLNDGATDMFSQPDAAGAPGIRELPGVYIHAALLLRMLRASRAAPADGPADAPGDPGLRALRSDLSSALKEAIELQRLLGLASGEDGIASFLRAMDAGAAALERLGAEMSRLIDRDAFERLPASEHKRLRDSFEALFTWVPDPAALPAREDTSVADRYYSAVDSLMNQAAFVLDAEPGRP